MKRASWNAALLAVVASAGVAWGQPAESTVTLQEKGGLPEPCRVVKTWTTADGRSAFLLRSIDTDELLTAVRKTGAKSGDSQIGVGIYRWGNRTEPPEGAPAPPPDGGVRQASHTAEAAPHVKAVSFAAPVPAAAHPASCASGGCSSGHCNLVHHYETPATIHFRPGECVPVCSPAHAPNYGYYATQWHPFLGGTEAQPAR